MGKACVPRCLQHLSLTQVSSLTCQSNQYLPTQLKSQAGVGWIHFVGSWKHVDLQNCWHFAGWEFENALVSSRLIHGESLCGLAVWGKRKQKTQRLHHKAAAAAWASELPGSLAHYLAYSLLLAGASNANILTAHELHGVSICWGAAVCYQLFPLQLLLWAPECKTRSSKTVAAAQNWNRNQTSEPQVHTVNKPCFSPSRRTCSNTIYK